MARRPRLRIAGVPQHVIQRGNNRQATFFAPEDQGFYLACLQHAARRHDCAIHAYVLMSNHVHLLVTPSRPEAMSLVMRDVGRRYVQYINYRELFSGHLDEKALTEIRGAVDRGWPLGSERFKDEIEAALQRAARPPRRGRPSRRMGASEM